MSDEEFRKLLIYMLKNYKIYYLDISGKYEEYYELDKYTKQINNIIKNYKNILKNYKTDNYKFINSYGKINVCDIEIQNINYKSLLLENRQKLVELLNTKTFNINDDYSLKEIADELSKIGDYEEFDYIYENSKLLELQEIMNQDFKAKLKYIQENSNKKIG